MGLRVILASVLVAGSGISPLLAQAATDKQLNIPQQELGSALAILAKQANIQLVYPAQLVEGKKSRAIIGHMTPETALARILDPVGLKYEFLDPKTVTIWAAAGSEEHVPVAAALVSGEPGSNQNKVIRLAQATTSGSIPISVGSQTNDPAAAASQASGLEEIVVTAQKRTERLIDVPSSVITLGSETLEARHLVNLEDYAAQLPGLVMNIQPGGYTQLAIRGLSTGNGGSNPTVATYIDNAPVGSSTSKAFGGLLAQDLDPNDVQQIEVLRGPQGTLYGADNIGGLVKFDTIAPNLKQVQGRVWLDGVDDMDGGNGYAARARVSVPLVADSLAVLVSAFKRQDPGFISNSALGFSDLNKTITQGGSAAVLWKPIADLAVKLSTMAYDRTIGGPALENVEPSTLTPIYGDLQQRLAASTGGINSAFRLYTANLDWNLGWGTVSSTTSYDNYHYQANIDYTGFFQAPFAASLGPDLGYAVLTDIKQNKVSEELRLEFSTGASFDWRMGGFYTRERGLVYEGAPTFNPVTGVPVSPGVVLLNAFTPTVFSEYAGFGEGTYHITPKFDVMGGLRYARNDQTAAENYSGLLTGRVNILVSSTGHSTTFDFSPRYKFDDDLMIYGRIASGYRPGGSNYLAIAGTPATYGPDSDVDYEAGIKMSLPQQRLSFDVAVFYVDWTDVQLALLTPLNLGYTDNVGGASSRGIESSISYMPTSALTFGAALSYTDAQLEKAIPSGAYGQKGDQLPYSPRWKANLSADYNFGPIGDWVPYAGADYLLTGSELANFSSSAKVERPQLPAYQTFDAHAGVHDEMWTVQFFAKNIADKRGFVSANAITGNPSGPYAAGIIQPRTIGVSLISRF